MRMRTEYDEKGRLRPVRYTLINTTVTRERRLTDSEMHSLPLWFKVSFTLKKERKN